MLEKCVISQDPDFTEVFEVLEWSKESLLIKVNLLLHYNSLLINVSDYGLYEKYKNGKIDNI